MSTIALEKPSMSTQRNSKYEGQVATTLREMGNKNMSDSRKNNQTTLSMSQNKKQEKSLHPPWHSYNRIFSSKDIQTTHV